MTEREKLITGLSRIALLCGASIFTEGRQYSLYRGGEEIYNGYSVGELLLRLVTMLEGKYE